MILIKKGMKTWLPLVCLSMLLAGGNTRAAETTEREVLPDNVTPTHYDVQIVPDREHLSFAGAVKIDLQVKQPTRQIVFNAADLAFGNIELSGADTAPEVALDAQRQTATLTFGNTVAAGHHVLTLAYTGKINQSAAGLFALDYDAAQGSKRALYTQFENSDARRFLPCWDEPARKASFTLTAIVPEGEMAVSNMPPASSEALPDGRKRVRFAQTPPMSSYLLFFALGDFERVARKVDGVDVGVVVKRGETAKAGYVLDVATQVLPYYNQYFGVKYPLPKLDLIAAPGSSPFFGAMENWGAIMGFEYAMLIDPKISRQADRRLVYVVMAHEMAHQWFGDLVTMQWWDDVWLNEGFASWMENRATQHFHPEWQMEMQVGADKETAEGIDALQGTHPVVTPIHDVLQASQAFDMITYLKGQAVIRMLEADIGENAFRAGVRRYMRKHAYGNTVTTDFWRELDHASSSDVSGIARDFTLQAGMPLIGVTPAADGIRLTQSRFSSDDSGQSAVAWRIPVLARSLDGGADWHSLVSGDKPVSIAAPADAAVLVNAGQPGYFRTLYAAPQMRALIARFPQLAPEDELGLLNDTAALGYSAYEPMEDFLQITQQTAPDMNPAYLTALTGKLLDLDALYDGAAGQAKFREYCLRLLQPLWTRTGWTASDDEDQNVTLLRAALLRGLSRFGSAAVVSEARERFAAYLENPTTLSGDMRYSVLSMVAEHADVPTWEQLHALARNATNLLDKKQLYVLLTKVESPELVQRTLQLILQDETPVTIRPELISRVSMRHPDATFDFAVAHLDAVMALLEPGVQPSFVPGLLETSNNAAMIPKLHAYAEAHIPADARSMAVKTEAAIAYNAKISSTQLPEVDRWLARLPQ